MSGVVLEDGLLWYRKFSKYGRYFLLYRRNCHWVLMLLKLYVGGVGRVFLATCLVCWLTFQLSGSRGQHQVYSPQTNFFSVFV